MVRNTSIAFGTNKLLRRMAIPLRYIAAGELDYLVLNH